ncbi:hypothetical protein TruAng_001566 [Truncatella angustata]|nr:hypothetical protein TruAng_001566 [Truncatella angustata]
MPPAKQHRGPAEPSVLTPPEQLTATGDLMKWTEAHVHVLQNFPKDHDLVEGIPEVPLEVAGALPILPQVARTVKAGTESTSHRPEMLTTFIIEDLNGHVKDIPIDAIPVADGFTHEGRSTREGLTTSSMTFGASLTERGGKSEQWNQKWMMMISPLGFNL